MSDFASLGLSAPILKALVAQAYTTPTPIQSQAIPIVLGGGDLIGLAQTGTGKTAAFALPMLQRLSEARQAPAPRTCRALVLAPTRELASQIETAIRDYGRHCGLRSGVVYGGTSMERQRVLLSRGLDVLVATPGRLLDHVEQRNVSLSAVEILVLDEADHMLDLGFIHALRRIVKLVPARRQTLFFSATMPGPIAELAAQFLTNPQRVAVTPPATTAERVEQVVIHVNQSAKQAMLEHLLADRAISRALVFTRTKHGADRVAKHLAAAGVSAAAIHGNKSQSQRERALDAFRTGQVRLLVATEIAARGIDVDDVSHVINFDLPNVPEQYVHRIGRTARAGAGGRAISFCAPEERTCLRDIERVTRQRVPVLEIAGLPPAPAPGPRTPDRPRPQQPRPEGQRSHGPGRHGGGARRAGSGKPAGRNAPRRSDEVWSNAAWDRSAGE